MNIRQGAEYADGESAPYADLIKSYDPDIIALQEVDYKTVRNGSQLTIQHFASINKAFFAEDTVTPALMIGDYNAASGSDPINYVKNKWQEIIPNMGPTIPSDKPTTQLDYIMGYPKASWTCSSYEIIARQDLSDHCFIVADLQISIGNE